MKKGKAQNVTQNFRLLDFHDDGLRSIKVCPPQAKVSSARVDLEFRDDSTGATKLLSFRSCANMRHLMDFDVLASNWAAQTHGTLSVTNVERMKKFVQSHRPYWHTEYMPPSPKDEPIRSKLSSLRKYVLFRMTFFGGIVEVLARDFVLKTTNKL